MPHYTKVIILFNTTNFTPLPLYSRTTRFYTTLHYTCSLLSLGLSNGIASRASLPIYFLTVSLSFATVTFLPFHYLFAGCCSIPFDQYLFYIAAPPSFSPKGASLTSFAVDAVVDTVWHRTATYRIALHRIVSERPGPHQPFKVAAPLVSSQTHRNSRILLTLP